MKKKLTVEKYIIQPNSTLSWHTNIVPNAGYILEGSLIVEDFNGQKHIYQKGDGVIKSINNVRRGIAGAQGVVLVAVYSSLKNLSLTIPT